MAQCERTRQGSKAMATQKKAVKTPVGRVQSKSENLPYS